MNRDPSRPLRLLAAAVVALAAAPSLADANMGVPMLAVMAVPMWLSLLVIIPIEAWVSRRTLGLGWGLGLRLAGLANIVSTLLGVPVTWVAVLLIQGLMSWMARGALEGHTIARDASPLAAAGAGALQLALQGAWLFPRERDAYWLVPAAALLLCVPFFYASVWIEYAVGRRLLSQRPRADMKSWAWDANLRSYALIVIATGAVLGLNVVRHVETASDDAHRPVATVSAERLWDLAVARVEAENRSANGSHGYLGWEARGPAPSRADSLWRHGDDAAHSGDDATAERDWVASLAEFEHSKVDRRARESGVSRWDAMLDLANLYQRQSRDDGALPLYQQLASRADSLAAHGKVAAMRDYPIQLGAAYEHLGDPDRAERVYRHLIDATRAGFPGAKDLSVEASLRLAALLATRGNSVEAEEQYRLAMERSGRDDDANRARVELARIYRAQGRYTPAGELLAVAIANRGVDPAYSEFPDSTGAGPLFLELARVHLDAGSWGPAEHCIKSALRYGDDPWEAAELYARWLEDQGRRSEASAWRGRARLAPKGRPKKLS